MAMNYTSLINDLKLYMLRTDQPFVNKLPDLIQQGIIRVYNRAKDLGFEIKYEINNVAAGQSTLQKPANWRETICILMYDTATQKFSYLAPRSREFMVTYWPYRANIQRNRPKYYSDGMTNVNNADLTNTYTTAYWLFSPTMDMEYNFEIIYLGIPLFNNENQTNFLTQRYPDLLLYSCLIEASLFLDNPAKLAEYKNLFNEELDTINKINKDRSADRTVIRDNN
jgi:hypothetical protein